MDSDTYRIPHMLCLDKAVIFYESESIADQRSLERLVHHHKKPSLEEKAATEPLDNFSKTFFMGAGVAGLTATLGTLYGGIAGENNHGFAFALFGLYLATGLLAYIGIRSDASYRRKHQH